MAGTTRLPFIPYDELRIIVADYMDKCGINKDIPIDVEFLLDNAYQINIIPFPSLFKGFGINAFMSNDFSKMYVDEYLYSNLEPQYRFTIAHELGHMILHTEWYRQFRIENIASYLEYLSGVREEDYRILETQASNFAGLFLVPPEQLAIKFKEKAREIVRYVQSEFKGIRRDKYLNMVVEIAAQKLSRDFNVHHSPIMIRIERDKLTDFIP
ncbi:MAG: ImmA/IrrE family metallo-endopeptidase [Acidobacteriota bacterium]|nr:ImmA/IrrE family metallo-endopeptidase [Acidobacteriota bacterium]